MVGESELSEGKVVVKNVETQEQLTLKIDQLIHQLDHWLDENHVCEHEH